MSDSCRWALSHLQALPELWPGGLLLDATHLAVLYKVAKGTAPAGPP